MKIQYKMNNVSELREIKDQMEILHSETTTHNRRDTLFSPFKLLYPTHKFLNFVKNCTLSFCSRVEYKKLPINLSVNSPLLYRPLIQSHELEGLTADLHLT